MITVAKAVEKLATAQETECSCHVCKGFCQRPCWPTPEEAQAIINAGLGERLALDYYPMDMGHRDIELLSPAPIGHEGGIAPFNISQAGCTFLTWKLELCQLHKKGLKPIEGRLAYHNDDDALDGGDLHQWVAATWRTPEGRALVRRWKREHDLLDE